MGHYDDCYEAEERRKDEKLGREYKARIAAMSDEQAGIHAAIADHVFRLAARLGGTADDHRSLESFQKQWKGTLK